MKESVAVIGSGIAGMSVAYYLRNQFDVTLIEKNSYAGGHTNTVNVRESDRSIPIDTGFMVFNETTYPNLVRLFSELGVISYNTSMSFGVRNIDTRLEYASTGFAGFFAQKRNLVNLRHWNLYSEITKFFKAADELILRGPEPWYTMAEFAKDYSLSRSVMNDFILPMAGAIWSTPPEGILNFPALPLLQFMQNHRMLGIGTQLQWKTVESGSEQYKQKLLARLPNEALLSQSIASIHQDNDTAYYCDERGQKQTYDYIIVATHSNHALALLSDPSSAQKSALSAFKYNRNKAVLHTCDSVMPRSKNAWASWNVLHSLDSTGNSKSSTHYWMNSLQNLETDVDYFVSIDYDGEIDREKIRFSTTYEHPLFDEAATRAKERLPGLNTNSRIRFCGSYFCDGFHEDALWSSLKLVDELIDEKGGKREFLPL